MKFSVRVTPMSSGLRSLDELGAVFEVGAGGVAEGVAAALVGCWKSSRMSGASSLAKPSSWRMRLCQNSARASADSTPKPWR